MRQWLAGDRKSSPACAMTHEQTAPRATRKPRNPTACDHVYRSAITCPHSVHKEAPRPWEHSPPVRRPFKNSTTASEATLPHVRRHVLRLRFATARVSSRPSANTGVHRSWGWWLPHGAALWELFPSGFPSKRIDGAAGARLP